MQEIPIHVSGDFLSVFINAVAIVLAGVLGAALTLYGVRLQNKSERERALNRRKEELEDRNYQTKKEVYAAMMTDVHKSAIQRYAGSRGGKLDDAALTVRANNIALFDLFASTEAKNEMNVVSGFLSKVPPPIGTPGFDKYKSELKEALKKLRKVVEDELHV